MRSDRENTLEAEITRLDGLGLQELRQVWRQRLGPPPRHISTELTRRRLAYELQVKLYGGLKPETRRRLNHGSEHRVTVLEKGFEYRGEPYGSLSQVARRIAGSRWSGPAFFGLKRRRDPTVGSHPSRVTDDS
jgi:Protein of unknown function (DUF2924)